MSYKLASLLSTNTSKSNYEYKLELPDEFESFVVKQDINSFKQDSLVQEQVLALKVSETLLNVDPLLDMSPAFESARTELLKKADSLYNLSVITMLPDGFQEYLANSLKPAYKYMFDHSHLWKTTALLACQGQDDKGAITALTESFRVNEDPYTAMLLARKCYNLQELDCDLGIKYSQLALKRIEEQGLHEIEKSKALISLGVGKSIKGRNSALVKEKQQLQDEALKLFEEAITLDSHDPLPYLCSAKLLAENREIDKSFKKVRQALILDPECLPALQLVILILTAKKNYQGALESLKDSLKSYPGNKLLMSVKCHIALHLGFKDSALKTCLDFFKLTSAQSPSFVCNIEDLTDLPRSLKESQASENQSTILGISSSTTSENKELTRAWLLIAEVYLKLNRLTEVEECLNEAMGISPLSSDVFVMRGRVREANNDQQQALHMYNLALTADPCNVDAIYYLSSLLIEQGNTETAETLLRQAASLKQTSHQIIFKLATLIAQQGDLDNAEKYFTYAMYLEETCPIVPFSTVAVSV